MPNKDYDQFLSLTFKLMATGIRNSDNCSMISDICLTNNKKANTGSISSFIFKQGLGTIPVILLSFVFS